MMGVSLCKQNNAGYPLYPSHMKVRIQQESKTYLANVLMEDNGSSGECASAYSNKLPPCSVLAEINYAV